MENSAQQQLLVEISDFLAPDLLHRGYEQAVDDMVEEGHPRAIIGIAFSIALTQRMAEIARNCGVTEEDLIEQMTAMIHLSYDAMKKKAH